MADFSRLSQKEEIEVLDYFLKSREVEIVVKYVGNVGCQDFMEDTEAVSTVLCHGCHSEVPINELYSNPKIKGGQLLCRDCLEDVAFGGKEKW